MEDVAPNPTRPANTKKMPLWRTKKVLVILAIVILAVLGWYFFIRDTSVPGANQTKTSTISGTSFAFPGNWQLASLTDSDKKAGVILKLYGRDPVGSFIWRAIKGKLDKNLDISRLPDQLNASLVKEISDYKSVSKGLDKIGSSQVVKLRYTRTSGTDEKTVYENLMYVVPRANQTDYLTFSAKQNDFGKIESGFSKILDSFNSYVTAHP